MHVFWNNIIRPLLSALRPRSIVEIGAQRGQTTEKLLELATEIGSVVHVVEPAPLFDRELFASRFGERFVLHEEISLAALPRIEARIDAALLDGDHNWHTVLGELRLLARNAEGKKSRFPLVLLHDVGWPYGRRDLYYDPDTIPDGSRHPYAQRGVRPGQRELADGGGLNRHLCNALLEGGPRNGILTAVEDFLKECGLALDLSVVPGFHGLGILADREMLLPESPVAPIIHKWKLCPDVSRYVQQLENARLGLLLQKLESESAAVSRPPAAVGEDSRPDTE